MTSLAEVRLTRSGADAFAELAAAFRSDGAMLVRGFELSLDDFESLTRHFCTNFHEVGTRQAMRQLAGDGHTTEVFPQNFILLGHAEGAYRPLPLPPQVCFFMCLTPPAAAGGETTVIDGAAMLEQIPSALRRRLETSGVRYESLWEPARWRAEFRVDSETELRALLENLPGTEFTLHDHGMLHWSWAAPAITRSRSGVPVFANGVLAHLPRIVHPRYAGLPVYTKASNRVHFGDGPLLDDDSVNALIDAHDKVVFKHRWRAHDVLVLDNTRYMHGRNMTEEPCARVLVSRFGHLFEGGIARATRPTLLGDVAAAVKNG